MRAALAFLLPLAVVAGCFTPNLGEGMVACGDSGACPTRYYCHAADQRCYTTPDPGGGGGDLAVTDGAGAPDMTLVDLAGADLTACIKAACGNRNCGTIPDGCGSVESCGGMCTGSENCGGGNTGMPNVCGSGKMCTRLAQCPADACGLISDGCAAVLFCPDCSGGKVCGSDHKCH